MKMLLFPFTLQRCFCPCFFACLVPMYFVLRTTFTCEYVCAFAHWYRKTVIPFYFLSSPSQATLFRVVFSFRFSLRKAVLCSYFLSFLSQATLFLVVMLLYFILFYFTPYCFPRHQKLPKTNADPVGSAGVHVQHLRRELLRFYGGGHWLRRQRGLRHGRLVGTFTTYTSIRKSLYGVIFTAIRPLSYYLH